MMKMMICPGQIVPGSIAVQTMPPHKYVALCSVCRQTIELMEGGVLREFSPMKIHLSLQEVPKRKPRPMPRPMRLV